MAIRADNRVIPSPSIQDVGRLVRAQRKAAGLRQIDVAQRAGLSRSRLVDLERGKAVQGLSFHHLNALLGVVGLELAVVLKHDPADVAAHHRNALRVSADLKLRVPSIG